MADENAAPGQPATVSVVKLPLSFEELLKCAPIAESLLLQLSTDSVLALYHTSRPLRNFLRTYPTSWKYLSFRLYQPSTIVSPAATNAHPPRQPGNYSLDQLLIYVVNPFSTCLTSLELDNTGICGHVLAQTVLALRRETLEHLSVRGCKNVSLKYHINPWLTMFSLVKDVAGGAYAPAEYQSLALKSLYTYRCRHHRRRPYLPSSLTRKDSDSEPTHELVNLCHKLGIWTDTAWCTTPGGRCFRRRGYVTLRVPQDPREVWVVYDRLWRCRNWIGLPEPHPGTAHTSPPRKRKRDVRTWEHEEAVRGEPLGTTAEGKGLPAHLRNSHRQFVENIRCDGCEELILERCEQCSITMHCAGCRLTYCASCAYDRPYLRNKHAPEEDRHQFWWAPGCAVSPCAMADQDPTPMTAAPANAPPTNAGLPNLIYKWCCTEPVFSGGGGITFGPGSTHEHDQIRAAPLKSATGRQFIDPEFQDDGFMHKIKASPAPGPAGRWKNIDGLFKRDDLEPNDRWTSAVPRNLCNSCHDNDRWKVKCKTCAVAICLKHDVNDKLRARVCGYKDLPSEKQAFRTRQKAANLKKLAGPKASIRAPPNSPRRRMTLLLDATVAAASGGDLGAPEPPVDAPSLPTPLPPPATPTRSSALVDPSIGSARSIATPATHADASPAPPDTDRPARPNTPGSNSTAAPSRASSPSPSVSSSSSTHDPSPAQAPAPPKDLVPDWRGCQSFICPATRTPGDHRRRCVAVVHICQRCKINVCGDCIAGMEPSCPCTGCRAPETAGAHQNTSPAGGGSETPRFFCPNCRWARRQEGSCKKRVGGGGGGGGKRNSKGRWRKPVGERVSRKLSADAGRTSSHDTADVMPAGHGGVEDEAIEMVAEFLGAFDMAPPSAAPPDEAATRLELQELEDMGVLARELMRRIRRLRAHVGPPAGGWLGMPGEGMDAEDGLHGANEADDGPTATAGLAPALLSALRPPPASPVVDDMD